MYVCVYVYTTDEWVTCGEKAFERTFPNLISANVLGNATDITTVWCVIVLNTYEAILINTSVPESFEGFTDESHVMYT